jgi:hypothetical protein
MFFSKMIITHSCFFLNNKSGLIQTSVVATVVRHVERKAISLQIHNLAQKTPAHQPTQPIFSCQSPWHGIGPPVWRVGNPRYDSRESIFRFYTRYARFEQIRVLPAREVTVLSAVITSHYPKQARMLSTTKQNFSTNLWSMVTKIARNILWMLFTFISDLKIVQQSCQTFTRLT